MANGAKDFYAWVKTATDAEIKKVFTSNPEIAKQMAVDPLSYVFAVKKIANVCSEAEFNEFLETSETPPIKLSAAEMSALKGGKGNKEKNRIMKEVAFKPMENLPGVVLVPATGFNPKPSNKVKKQNG